MAQVTISGSLSVAPATVTDSTFPAATSSVPLTTTPIPKVCAVDTGIQRGNINSPSSYAALSGVGASPETVTQGSILYVRCAVPMLFKLAFHNPLGADDEAVIPITGTVIMEFDPSRYLTALSVKGSGTIEWYVGGPQ